MASESHNVDVTVPAQGGVSCQQTLGGTSPSAARFPNVPTSGSWAGVCTFTRAGTYSFQCDQHEGMTGTVVVTDAGSTQPTAPTAPCHGDDAGGDRAALRDAGPGRHAGRSASASEPSRSPRTWS